MILLFICIRSRIDEICGDNVKPVLYPQAVNTDDNLVQTDPFPK